AGLDTLVLSAYCGEEARLLGTRALAPLLSLPGAARVLRGGAGGAAAGGGVRGGQADAARGARRTANGGVSRGRAAVPAVPLGPDLADVRGLHHAVRALVDSAGGGAQTPLLGPSGARKE